MSAQKTKYYPPFAVINTQKHLEYAFSLWNIKNPSPLNQFLRSLYFVSALTITIFWPITDLFLNFLLILLTWFILSLFEKSAPRPALLLLIMLTITCLFNGIQILTDLYQNFLISVF